MTTKTKGAKRAASKPAAKTTATTQTNETAAKARAETLAADLERVKASVKPKGDAISRLDKRAAARANAKARDDAKQAERDAIRAKRFPTAAAQEKKGAGTKGGTPQVPAIEGTTPLGMSDAKKPTIGEQTLAQMPWKRNLDKAGPPLVKVITIPEGLKEDAPAPRIVKGGASADEKAALDKKIADATTPPDADDTPVENVQQLHERLERSREGGRQVAEPMAPVESITCPVLPLKVALLTAAKSDVRFYLQTVRLHLHGNDVRAVSTDGHQMLVQTLTQVSQRPAWLDAKGVLFSAGDLAAALGVCAKHGETVTITTGVGHPFATFISSDQFCQFRIGVVEGQFPDYQKIMNDVDLSNEGGDPLAVASLNPAYVRAATAVAKELGAKAMQTFAGNEKRAATFLFQGADAIMIVMPMREDSATRLVTTKTIAMVGGGLASSVGALRAHLTRTTEKMAATTDAGEKAKLGEKVGEYRERIDAILRMSREALPAPTKKSA